MKLLAIGAKPILTAAIAGLPGVEVVAMERDIPSRAIGDGPSYEIVPYGGGQKLSLSAIREVRTAIQRVRPDVVHAFYPRPLAEQIDVDCVESIESGRPVHPHAMRRFNARETNRHWGYPHADSKKEQVESRAARPMATIWAHDYCLLTVGDANHLSLGWRREEGEKVCCVTRGDHFAHLGRPAKIAASDFLVSPE